jgi:hypothetical protein
MLAAAFVVVAPGLTFAASERPGVIETQVCAGFEVEIFGYGAGLMMQTAPISATEPRILATDANNNCTVLEWETNIISTAQIIYAEEGAAPGVVDISNESFLGFPSGTTQNNEGTERHRAILTGLEAGKTYVYRVVTRAHPSALPNVSGPYSFTAGASAVSQSTSAVPSITLTVTTTPTPTAPTTPSIVYTPPATVPTEIQKTSQEQAMASPQAEGTATPSDTPREAAGGETDTEDMIAAATAADEAAESGAFGTASVASVFDSARNWFSSLKPNGDRLNFSPGLGLFEEDSYIIPMLFFLLILFLLQQLLLPAIGMPVKQPIVFWLFGSLAVAALTALLGYYYIALAMTALFAGLLIWFTIISIPYGRRRALTNLFTMSKDHKRNLPAKIPREEKS